MSPDPPCTWKHCTMFNMKFHASFGSKFSNLKPPQFQAFTTVQLGLQSKTGWVRVVVKLEI